MANNAEHSPQGDHVFQQMCMVGVPDGWEPWHMRRHHRFSVPHAIQIVHSQSLMHIGRVGLLVSLWV